MTELGSEEAEDFVEDEVTSVEQEEDKEDEEDVEDVEEEEDMEEEDKVEEEGNEKELTVSNEHMESNVIVVAR